MSGADGQVGWQVGCNMHALPIADLLMTACRVPKQLAITIMLLLEGKHRVGPMVDDNEASEVNQPKTQRYMYKNVYI